MMGDKNRQVDCLDEKVRVAALEEIGKHAPSISAHDDYGMLLFNKISEQLIRRVARKDLQLHIIVMRPQPLLHLVLVLDAAIVVFPHVDDSCLLLPQFGEQIRELLDGEHRRCRAVISENDLFDSMKT